LLCGFASWRAILRLIAAEVRWAKSCCAPDKVLTA
jgi:hypothetical protein